MEVSADRRETAPEVTRALAGHAAALRFESLPEPVVLAAKSCLLDWLGVTLAATDEPLVRMLTDQVAEDGGAPQATLLGRGTRVAAGQAALVNGAAGHALDFDDVLGALSGHPTVPVMPAVLALAEKRGLDGRAVLAAFAAGVETEARIGLMMAQSHYARGFHATATIGTLGAAAACANLLGFDAERTATALGIAGTQAAGLKSMFGTMCKPLHAGKAAQNGLLAANLAARGFTSRPDVLDCVQGFADTQADRITPEAALAGLGSVWHLPDTLFKYHPACYGTHAPIEAARRAAANPAFAADRVERVEVRVDPRCLRMCDIPAPVTGLEGKFSLRYNVGLALAGRATGALASYEDAAMAAPEVVRLRDLVRVEATEGLTAHEAEVIVHLKGGIVLRERYDVGAPMRDLAAQWDKLVGKFHALTDPLIGAARADAVARLVQDFERQPDVRGLMAACAITG